MGKIRNVVRFSSLFGLSPDHLDAQGALNPTLSADTQLFIDPLLLQSSSHPEISGQAYQTYQEHFRRVVMLLRKCKEFGDTYWRNAKRMMQFPEVHNTCLGYGSQSTSGSGSGVFLTDHIMRTAFDIVALGVEEPDMFVAMALFEEGMGPDRLSDMTTNIIVPALVAYTNRVLKDTGVPQHSVKVRISKDTEYPAHLPLNPFRKGPNNGIILVPQDILRGLPLAFDWDGVEIAASFNDALRGRVNKQVAEVWQARTIKDKRATKLFATSSKENFEFLLDQIKHQVRSNYDFAADPKGELFWTKIQETIAQEFPLRLEMELAPKVGTVDTIVRQIIEQFRFLIEERRLSETLYSNNQPRPEKSAQHLFFAVAFAYCKANNLDLTPEADTGNGPVDFKVSVGYRERVIIEIKLSTNGKVVKGYTHQLEAYAAAEEPVACHYVVLDVGKMGRKRKELESIHGDRLRAGSYAKQLTFIDATQRPSASHL